MGIRFSADEVFTASSFFALTGAAAPGMKAGVRSFLFHASAAIGV
jgi:hypothetical protein